MADATEYFAALSTTPALVGISVGARRGEAKDTLENIRAANAKRVTRSPFRDPPTPW